MTLCLQAYQYLMELPGVTSLHRRDDPSVEMRGEENGAHAAAVAKAAVKLAAAPGITLPEVLQIPLARLCENDPRAMLAAIMIDNTTDNAGLWQ